MKNELQETKAILLAKYNPELLAKELEMEDILKSTLPGIKVDDLPYAIKEELCQVINVSRKSVDVQKALSIDPKDFKDFKDFLKLWPELDIINLTTGQIAQFYELYKANQGRK